MWGLILRGMRCAVFGDAPPPAVGGEGRSGILLPRTRKKLPAKFELAKPATP